MSKREDGEAAACCSGSILIWREVEPSAGPEVAGWCLAIWASGDVHFERVEFCPSCGAHESEIRSHREVDDLWEKANRQTAPLRGALEPLTPEQVERAKVLVDPNHEVTNVDDLLDAGYVIPQTVESVAAEEERQATRPMTCDECGTSLRLSEAYVLEGGPGVLCLTCFWGKVNPDE
jgi:hypothetical protein